MPAVPPTELECRLQALRKLMRKDRLGAVVITSPTSVHYYSGFTGDDSIILVTSRKLCLLTDFRYVEEGEQSTHNCQIITWRKSPYTHCGELLSKFGCKQVGFEAARLSVTAHGQLKKSARGVKLIPWDRPIMLPRSQKSAWEVKAIARALRVAENSFTDIRARVKPGMLETDLARELEYQMAIRGASSPAFPTIVATGANASRPHAHPGRRKIRSGGLILIDWGACVNHYNSDLTRTLFVDSIPPLWRRRYEAVLNSQLLALQDVASSRTGAEVDAVARNALKVDGLAKRFGHSLGHGVGLEVHELPNLGSRNDQFLAAGAVVTVEPGVYFPRSGGIRIEDMVLVGKEGGTVLSRLPKNLDWAII